MLETISTFTLGQVFDIFPTELASPNRDSFTYETYAGPLQDPAGANGAFDLYQAEREEGGWRATHRLSRSATGLTWPLPGGISSDHTYSLTNEGLVDYLRSPDGTFELTGIGSLGEEPNAQGRYISEGGAHVIFATGDGNGQSGWCNGCPVLQLEPDAAPTGTGTVYDREADGETRVISLLPGDIPQEAGQEAFYQGASRDGSTVAFKVQGTLYVRVDNQITRKVAEGASTFAGLSDDGEEFFYLTGGTTHAGNIHRFYTSSGQDVAINSSADAEVVNVSADGSHVYLISPSQLDGTKGVAGQPNLYVWSGGVPEYITTVVASDLEKTSGDLNGLPALTSWTKRVTNQPEGGGEQGPGASATRTTPDGTVLVFESRAQLTAYDNDGHTEIYRYDDDDKSLLCVSCNPLTEPATGDARLQELHLIGPPIVIHNLSADGNRVFFETPEALAAGDINGEVNDIYEWQQEEGGSTSVALISSGKSPGYPLPEGWESPFAPLPNLLLGIAPSGSDVFFSAKEALVPAAGENGTQAIYDARVNGGFPEPEPPVICAEDECKGQPGAPPSLSGSPPSEDAAGSGNVKPRKRHRCRRGKKAASKHKKQHRCGKSRVKAGARRSALPSSNLVDQGAQQQAKEAASTPVQQAASEPAGATTAVSPVEDFGIETLEAALSSPEAGAHPDFTTNFVLKHFQNSGFEDASASAENISVSLPPGLLGNPNAVPACSMGDFVSFGNCSFDTQVGVTRVRVGNPLYTTADEPVYNLTPPHPSKEIARLGFIAYFYPVFIDIKVRTAGDYGVTATIHSAPGLGSLVRAKTTLWGNPPDPSHDKQRFNPFEVGKCGGACSAEGNPSGLPPTAFLTNPSACQPMPLGLELTSYQLPGQVFTKDTEMKPITDCSGLPFDPSFAAEAANPTAGAPSGLKTTLSIPQQSTTAVNEPSTATMREARVTLPQGMAINPGAADGIAGCDEAQIGYHEEVDQACPDASKVGVAQIQSPLLPKPIGAEIFLRNQRPGHPYGLWLASDELGLHVKIPGDLEPDKQTGQLTAIFTDLPQTPVSQIDLNVWGGPRAPLTTPEDCGAYKAIWSFKPHSDDPPVTGSSQITIDQGCGVRGFNPKLHAGTTNPVAGAFSPFVFDLQREDAEQNLASLDLTLPDGLLAKLKGVPLCPEGATASGSCSAGSRVGHLTAAAGSGPNPLWVPQPGKTEPSVYLAGPYKGAPYSIVAVVPAQAGPFDLGNVVVRSALRVDPETARATVASDPLPQFFEGVGVTYRKVHVVVDRPEFTINPTDCSELAITSHLTSVKGAVAEPRARFQVDGCKALKYRPKLKLSFKGSTKRSGHPALKATLTQPPGQANTAKATVILPASEFIDQDHINNPCTRVQFREDKCPKLSVLGRVTAVTPLLDRPLSGNVYFRSNGGERELPDIVADLRGQIHATIVGWVDSVPVKGTELSRLRTRFATVPDAPVSKFQINLFGGAKRGLLENSRNLCKTNRRAKVSFTAQNGRQSNRNLLIKTSCGKR